MNQLLLASAVFVVLALTGCSRPAAPASESLLSVWAPQYALWNPDEAESEQTPAFELGRSARDRAAGVRASDPRPHLPHALWDLARTQFAALEVPAEGSVEGWPSYDAFGRPTWVFARAREPGGALRFLWQSKQPPQARADAPPVAVAPQLLDPSFAPHRRLIFAPFQTLDDLYQKPLFGNCVWVDADYRPFAGWLPAAQRAEREPRLLTDEAHCVLLPQPARLSGEPHTLIFPRAADGSLALPPEVVLDEPPFSAPVPEVAAPAVSLPADASERLARDVRALDGESEVTFPLSSQQMRFTRRSSAQPDHQLLDLVAYLQERYAQLQITSTPQSFSWLDIRQANLIARLPGTGESCTPVIVADHIDVAFADDVFATRHARVPVPGADDNALATAALLMIAEALRTTTHTHDIWLVHLTGEEFPADDLGARQFVSSVLEQGCAPRIAMVLDMIGWHGTEAPLLQIGASAHPAALAAAQLAATFARQLAPNVLARVHGPGDPRNYLYNTDAMTLALAGIPALLLNEHVNALENIDRVGYHDSQDLAAQIDFDFAASNVRVAAATLLALAR